MFWRLTTVADDFGRFQADPTILKANCFPRAVDRIKTKQIEQWRDEMIACNLMQTYVSNGQLYGFFITWEKYQTMRAKASRFPSPTDVNICSQMSPHSHSETKTESHSETSNTSPRPEEAWPSVELLVKLYNEKTPEEFPAVTQMSPARTKKAKQYLAAFPKQEFWEEVFLNCDSRFLRGLSRNGAGHENFKADFDWLLSKGKDGTENCVKVKEGKYGD